MEKLIFSFLITGLGTIYTPPSANPAMKGSETVVIDTIHQFISNNSNQSTRQRDTYLVSDTSKTEISIRSFGAICDGVHDDIAAWESAVAYVIDHPVVLTMPVGNSFISHPLNLQHVVNGHYVFFTIHIKGALPNKSSSNEYLSKITVGYKSGYAVNIELGRSIVIENITFMGQYSFPYSVSNAKIGVLKFSDWVDPSITDNRNNPYAGIVIDQFPTGGGSSDVTIQNCAFKQWMVGICLSPAGTVNDEMINILDDDIEACRVAIAIGQDQSKTINIKGLKVWASVHTIVDGVHYGSGTGGGSLFCENWNIAGNVNQLFQIVTDRFPLSCLNIYSESLFRMGSVGSGVGANFINCQIDFMSGTGWPEADYLISGQANFYGGMLRYYDGDGYHRLNFVNLTSAFRDMTLNVYPIISGLYGGVSTWPIPWFDHVRDYYWGRYIMPSLDTLISITPKSINIDRVNWTATLTGIPQAKINDYILAAPTNTSGWYYDRELNGAHDPTIQIGRVIKISADSLYLTNVGLNVYRGMGYDACYISRLKK